MTWFRFSRIFFKEFCSSAELVFQPFYRALGTNVDGSGLGLAIVQEIATQHDATIKVEDAALAGHPQTPGARITVRFAGREGSRMS